MDLKLLIKITAIVILFMCTSTAVAANVTIEKVNVNYDASNVSVEFYYQLDTVQKIKSILFGAEYIEEDILSLFNDTSDIRVDKVGFSHAEIDLDVITFNNTNTNNTNINTNINIIYFPGEELNKPVENVS